MKTRPVQIRLKPETIERLDALAAAKSKNRTQAIVYCIQLAEALDKLVLISNGRLYFKDAEGVENQIIFMF